MSGFDIFTGQPFYTGPTQRERERAADKWHYDADERTKNLKALERGGPVMFQGFSQPLVPVGYEQQQLDNAAKRSGQAELLRARMTWETATAALQEHQLSCEIFEENKTRKGGRGRGGKYKICTECVSLTKGHNFARQRVIELELKSKGT